VVRQLERIGAATLDDSDHPIVRIPGPAILPSRGLKKAHVLVLSPLAARAPNIIRMSNSVRAH